MVRLLRPHAAVKHAGLAQTSTPYRCQQRCSRTLPQGSTTYSARWLAPSTTGAERVQQRNPSSARACQQGVRKFASGEAQLRDLVIIQPVGFSLACRSYSGGARKERAWRVPEAFPPGAPQPPPIGT